jgi:NO-binding membrane sensor protein with MHYT domain
MGVAHEPWLVVLSLIVAIQGAYVGLNLALRVGEAVALRRRLLLAGAALSLAVAIWSMHFVAMLAARLPFPVDYLVFPTLLSFLVCVLVVGAGVFAASAGGRKPGRLAAAAVFMGSGTSAMHYIGMTALHASAHLEHALPFVVASVAVGIATSGFALWLAGGRGGRPSLFFSAAALGSAIAGMHYTAMAGLTLTPFGAGPPAAPALSPDLLAIVVAIVAFVISGVFLLTLVPDRSRGAADAGEPVTAPAAAGATTGPAAALEPAVDRAAALGHGTFGPLGGAGAPRRRTARQLPVERDGGTHFVSVDDIVAVQANAHYTHIFDGRAKLFCPLAIGVVESRLDKSRFLRVHRSHIVNVDRIVGLKRDGDAGIVDLGALQPYSVPVSRSRLGWLRARLGAKPGESGDGPDAASAA